ncbi:sigma-70 family RNA polymerase sigma factor [Fictibacillus nanhaiensis]|uniref:sigma-70 family RNA polymerase sigma factor n=1 Tax=Fictibacillus nanhaiensis TaxID=742169 RepID=UPI00203D626C|nr:sigma-70 family RNA polymerase sigma factor [Fictibacillus nanhaiensis]
MNEYIYPYENTHPLLKAKFESFIRENQQPLSNPIINSFLSNEEHYILFVNAVCFSSKENNFLLDQAFSKFLTEIRFINYISKTLKYFASNYRNRLKMENQRVQLLLDQPIKGDSENTFLEMRCVSDENVYGSFMNRRNKLFDHIENPSLYNGFKQLTEKQMLILELYFFNGSTHKEIATVLGVTQQAVSKSYKKALEKLKNCYKE